MTVQGGKELVFGDDETEEYRVPSMSDVSQNEVKEDDSQHMSSLPSKRCYDVRTFELKLKRNRNKTVKTFAAVSAFLF